MPAEPHRHSARGRTRVDAGILDRVPSSLEAHMRLGPQLLHDLDLLFRAAASVVEVLVEAGELDLVPADPDAEPEPAGAQHVETGRLFRDEHGLALREDQYPGRKAELVRTAGEVAEQHERVMEQTGAGAAGLRCAGLAGTEHMVGRLDEIVADCFSGLRIFPNNRGIAADIS